MKHTWIIIGCLVLYAVIILLPPLIHGYVYPDLSDDTAHHLAYIESLGDKDENVPVLYLGRAFIGYPLSWLNQTLGLSLNNMVLWFNYGVLILAGVVCYVLFREVLDWKAGLFAIPFIMFGTGIIPYMFYAGVIFDFITIAILFPIGVWLVVKIMKTKSKKWLAVTVVYIPFVLSFHSTAIFTVKPLYPEPVLSLGGIIINLLGILPAVTLVVGIICLMIIRPKLNVGQLTFITIVGSVAVLLELLALTTISAFAMRVANNFAVVMAMVSMFIMGLVIKNVKWRGILPITTLAVLLAVIPGVGHYYSYNSAMRGVDQKVIEYVNSLPGEYYSTTSEIAPWIYDRFITKEYKEGEYPYIGRTEPMTYKTQPGTPYYWYDGRAPLEGHIIRSFYDGEVTTYVILP